MICRQSDACSLTQWFLLSFANTTRFPVDLSASERLANTECPEGSTLCIISHRLWIVLPNLQRQSSKWGYFVNMLIWYKDDDEWNRSIFIDILICLVHSYLGHGNGSRFLLQPFNQGMCARAVTLVLGCSSGKPRWEGRYEPYSSLFNHLIAGW